MSKMATVPVFACRYCGKPVYVTNLSTRIDDPNSELLFKLMEGLRDIAMCKECRNRYNWYASQNRAAEMPLNPQGILYNIHDHSGLDYYGRNAR